MERVEALVNAHVDVIVIDSAHGHSAIVLRACRDVTDASPELQVIAAYDVQKRDKDGQPMKGLIRSTYLIDENGVIVKALDAVKAKENPAQMLEAL